MTGLDNLDEKTYGGFGRFKKGATPKQIAESLRYGAKTSVGEWDLDGDLF